MRNLIPIFVFLLLMMGTRVQAQSGYRVQLTALSESVPIDYFQDYKDVRIVRDHNDLYRVYLKDFSTRTEAEAALKEAKDKGYKYAVVIDMEEMKNYCATSCSPNLFVENIFFDYDKADLRYKSRIDLTALAKLMKENPGYKVILSAHTDAHGSNNYNINLSKRRAESARQYLIEKGVSAKRISTEFSGESQPIAKNELNGGKDSPGGRQFNRRVAVTLLEADGTIVPNVVKAIEVPPSLRF